MKLEISKKEAVRNYIKANRKGSRDASLENTSGFIAKEKVHTSGKTYIRSKKKNWKSDDGTDVKTIS